MTQKQRILDYIRENIRATAKEIAEALKIPQTSARARISEARKEGYGITKETYEIFKSLPIKDIAFVMGIKDYEKYRAFVKDWKVKKGTPIAKKVGKEVGKAALEIGVDVGTAAGKLAKKGAKKGVDLPNDWIKDKDVFHTGNDAMLGYAITNFDNKNVIAQVRFLKHGNVVFNVKEV